jgi:hypothetical protein
MGAGDVSMVGPEVLAALRAAEGRHGKGDPAGDGSEVPVR